MKNKDIEPENNKGEAHGLWKIYSCSGGELIYRGFYHNNKEVGYGEIFNYFNGKLNRKRYNI